MLGLVLKGSGALTVGVTGLLGGNFFYNRKKWKQNHPILQETVDMLSKDPKVIEVLGIPLEKTPSSVTGVLEPGKSWANISFQVEGPRGSAKVSLLADSKTKDLRSDEYVLEGSAPDYSVIEKWIKEWYFKDTSSEEQYWRLVSLHLRFDDITSYPVIAEGIRSHKQLKEMPEVTEMSAMATSEGEFKPNNKISERQMKIMKNARRRWMIMAVSIGSTLSVALIVRRFIKRRPVANSVFFHRVMDTLNTDPYARSQLGIPITHLQNVKGNLNYNFTQGTLETIVYGSQGFGRVKAEGLYQSKEKRWHITKLDLDTHNKTHSLV